MNNNTWFYSIILFLVIIFMLNACSTNNVTPSPAISTTPLPHSMKGYELYSWQVDGQWYFTLITGTNRLKTIEEITSYHNIVTEDDWVNIRVQGVEELKIMLGRLPKNEYVFWIGPKWLESKEDQTVPFTVPSKDIIDNIQEYCNQIDIDLTVSD